MKFAQVQKFALALPEATEAPHHHFSSFRVRGKIFVTIPPKQDALHVFVGEEEREQALALYPDFAEKLLWGGKVVGLRLVLEKARGKAASLAVQALVRTAWAHKAPKSVQTSTA